MSLNIVNSLLLNEEHVRLDKEVLAFDFIDPSNFSSAVLLLSVIAQHSEDTIIKKCSTAAGARDLLNENHGLHEKLIEAWKAKSFRGIRNLEILQAPLPQPAAPAMMYYYLYYEQAAATERSWTREYVGNVADLLWDHITEHFDLENSITYANYAAVVGSSGMGKSRMVDQLAKEQFVIPISLMPSGATGFPPADHAARDFLTGGTTSFESRHRACLFLQALFRYTNELLQETSFFGHHGSAAEVAQRFRELMMAGQKMGKPNKFRQNFYYAVVRHAEKLGCETSKADTSVACKELVETLRASQGLKLPTGGDAPKDKFPLVTIAFDEAHTLVEKHGHTAWSHFGALQAALRSLRELPVFSLFISTSAKISEPTPEEHDVLRRMLLKPIEPFTCLGFDMLASKVSLHPDRGLTLEEVTSDAHIVSLGRPLFRTRFDGGSEAIRDDIIMFAAAKLLNDTANPSELTDEQALACLTQRLPLEINPTMYATARRQVEAHMRVCMYIDPSKECMATISPSEPVLSEAAYAVMAQHIFDPPRALTSLMERQTVEKGDCGEPVALLLLTLARDRAVGPASRSGRPEQRHFKMAPFVYGSLLNPAGRLVGPSTSILQQLAADFPAAEMHFTHYIRPHELGVLDSTSLLLIATRSAGIACPRNHCAVDAINIFTHKGTAIACDNFGLVMHRVQSDPWYAAFAQDVFDVMDPYELGVLERGDTAVPLVRICFALAAEVPSLTVKRHEPSRAYGAIVYDIWCGGLSEELFAPIEEPETWSALLRVSSDWDTIRLAMKYQGFGDFWE